MTPPDGCGFTRVTVPDGRELFHCIKCNGLFFTSPQNKEILAAQHTCADPKDPKTFNNGGQWASEPGAMRG